MFEWRNTNLFETGSTIAAFNITGISENYLVEVAAPGMKNKDCKVELDWELPNDLLRKKENYSLPEYLFFYFSNYHNG